MELELYLDGPMAVFLQILFWVVITVAVLGLIFSLFMLITSIVDSVRTKKNAKKLKIAEIERKKIEEQKAKTTLQMKGKTYENVPEWLVRVVKEATDLKEKIDKLAAYINPIVMEVNETDNPQEPKCGWAQYHLLCDQLRAMESYYYALRDRVHEGIESFLYDEFTSIDRVEPTKLYIGNQK